MLKCTIKRLSTLLAGCSLWFALTGTVLAVEPQPVKIADKWSVVGVISGGMQDGKPFGIAVLRHNESMRTYTLSIGDQLPSEFGVRLLTIVGRQVVVGDQHQKETLAFAEASAPEAEPSEMESHTARFIDNYYRGLKDRPIEFLPEDVARMEGQVIERPLDFPLRRFGTLNFAVSENLPPSQLEMSRQRGLDSGPGDMPSYNDTYSSEVRIGESIDDEYGSSSDLADPYSYEDFEGDESLAPIDASAE